MNVVGLFDKIVGCVEDKGMVGKDWSEVEELIGNDGEEFCSLRIVVLVVYFQCLNLEIWFQICLIEFQMCDWFVLMDFGR